jgi:hypothetical protein
VSLIYTALNKLEQGQTGAPNPAVENPYAVTAKKPGAPRWVYLVVAGCVVVVLAGWLFMNALQAKLAAVPEPVSQAAVPAPENRLAIVPATAVPVADSVVVPVMTPVAALPPSPEPPGAASMAATAKEPVTAAPARPPARARSKPPAPMITEAAPPPPLDPQETAQLSQAVKRAIQAGKNDEAQNLLKQLATRLPRESITLLRLNAWHRMQSGDPAQAMVLYRQISERIPGDESAGINLALLHWKAGQPDEARRLIAALAERHPESETVQRYSRELGVLR